MDRRPRVTTAPTADGPRSRTAVSRNDSVTRTDVHIALTCRYVGVGSLPRHSRHSASLTPRGRRRQFSAARGNAPAHCGWERDHAGSTGPPDVRRPHCGGRTTGALGVRRGRRPTDKGVIVRKTTSKMWAAAAGVTGIALLATACSSGDGGSERRGVRTAADENDHPDGGTFNEFGYTDELYAEYEAEHPNVTIKNKKAETSDDARDNLQTRASPSGSGASTTSSPIDDRLDARAPRSTSDFFADLTDPAGRRPLARLEDRAGHDADGKLSATAPTSAPRPSATARTCSSSRPARPTVRTSPSCSVAPTPRGTTTSPSASSSSRPRVAAWFDSLGALSQGMINQVENAYEDPDGTIIAARRQLAEVKDDLRPAHQACGPRQPVGAPRAVERRLERRLQEGRLRHACCARRWMTRIIDGNAADVTGWDVADVFPGGASNWGGSFLTGSRGGQERRGREGPRRLADRSGAAAPGVHKYGNFPSQTEATHGRRRRQPRRTRSSTTPRPARSSPTVSRRIATQPFQGANYFPINDALSRRVHRGRRRRAMTPLAPGTRS